MFSKDITTSDAFREMPSSSQALYFHLGMEADDDGFLDNYKGLIRAVNASEDDLKVLIGKRFLIVFPSKVVVVKHWLINNTVRSDRYHETKHLEEKRALIVKENGAYTELSNGGIPSGNQVATEYRIEEKSIDTKNTFSFDGKELEEVDEDAPKREKVPTSKVPEWVEIWNRYPNWKAVGKTGTPPNPSVAKDLLPNTPSTDDIRSAVIRKRTKYTPIQFEQAVKNYVLEIVNRTKDKNGFYLHRYTMYEFLTHKNIFERYVNR